MAVLKLDAHGADVLALQQALKARGFDPGVPDGDFGPGTEAAVIAFQKSEGLAPDGVVGPLSLDRLGMPASPSAARVDVSANVTPAEVSRMFPETPLGNIKANLPFVLQAMHNANLGDKPMLLMALGTIRAETASFEPISEGRSRFNTSPNGHPFDLYDNRRDLGNRGAPDGNRFKGRGFVQLTGRFNYTTFSAELGMGTELVDDPDKANDPTIASQLLALFLKDKEQRIRDALDSGELAAARKLVNGGSHGVDDFRDAYRIGERVLPDA
ncbi:MAG: peptidoglycan-binding protein [Alphaproteobacteria bacterium]|nr:peptidoglycan-binding protein [Alphaproteobacteria bacterium]MBV9199886.1 peptidoglycan-binding protein [Alphaproteobacteria bacterium]MBV9377587.1 peptidoglycan-binding protein [Alphaproteobacteria bacterium]MBV9816160.1 peptidoglycan-binding protein [Alphaproteobacteria bacterium]